MTPLEMGNILCSPVTEVQLVRCDTKLDDVGRWVVVVDNAVPYRDVGVLLRPLVERALHLEVVYV